MPTIAVANIKGGPGKTTLALCLADRWQRAGVSVECVDADPSKNLSGWIVRAGLPIACQVADEDDVIDAVADAAKRVDMVVVDVIGALTRGLTYSAGAASCVLIPCRPDSKDILGAGRTRQEILTTAKMLGRVIPHAAVLTQVNRRTSVADISKRQLEAFEIPVLASVMPMRTAYQFASFTGSPLDDASVRDDIAAIGADIETVLLGS